eukprot:6492370-Amphidinium_carterae.1
MPNPRTLPHHRQVQVVGPTSMGPSSYSLYELSEVLVASSLLVLLASVVPQQASVPQHDHRN